MTAQPVNTAGAVECHDWLATEPRVHLGVTTQPNPRRYRVMVTTGFHHGQCSRSAVVWRDVYTLQFGQPSARHDGLGFCLQHDPVAANRKREERNARWAAERKARERTDAREAARRQVTLAAMEARQAGWDADAMERLHDAAEAYARLCHEHGVDPLTF